MSDFFSALKSTVKSIDEDVMKIFPITGASGFQLDLTQESKVSDNHVLLTATAKNESSRSEVLFCSHNDAFKELEVFTGKILNTTDSVIDTDKYETYYTEFKESSDVDFHDHPVDVVIFLVNGSISMRLEDGNTTVFKKGDFFFIPKGLQHHFSFGSEGAQCIELWKGKDFW